MSLSHRRPMLRARYLKPLSLCSGCRPKQALKFKGPSVFVSRLWQTGLTQWKEIWKWSSNMSLNQISPSAKAFWWRQFKEHLATVAAVIANRRKYHKIRPCNKRARLWRGRAGAMFALRVKTCSAKFIPKLHTSRQNNTFFKSVLPCPLRRSVKWSKESPREGLDVSTD